MREIKFRVWDKEHKMFLPNEIYDIHSRTSFGSFGIMRKDWRNYSIGEYFYDNAQILEQYTGLKDKNGKEIYEGDIIDVLNKHHTFNKVKLIVTFEDGSFCLREHERQEFNRCVGFRQNKVHAEALGKQPIYEVIGNIHQNPDLL